MSEPTAAQKERARDLAIDFGLVPFDGSVRWQEERIAQALADEADRAAHEEREACAREVDALPEILREIGAELKIQGHEVMPIIAKAIGQVCDEIAADLRARARAPG
jgi:hypothetical protein